MNSKLSETIRRVLRDESDVRAASAAHQQDFPYRRDAEAQVTRREFCNFLGLTSTALFLSVAGVAGKAAWESRQSKSFAALQIDGAEQLPPGAALNFHYPTPGDRALLVRAKDGQYYAYGQKCTHLSCPVYYAPEHDRLECPCHEGGFEVHTGHVLYGPPPRPLDRIALDIRANGKVWAVKKGS